MLVGSVAADHTPSGSLTVIVVLLTANTGVYGPEIETPIKSPTLIAPTGVGLTVMTLVDELKDDAVIPELLGIAPTHCATRLTNALAD
jgi:hypothetical protein